MYEYSITVFDIVQYSYVVIINIYDYNSGEPRELLQSASIAQKSNPAHRTAFPNEFVEERRRKCFSLTLCRGLSVSVANQPTRAHQLVRVESR